jgi:hypothetical protein
MRAEFNSHQLPVISCQFEEEFSNSAILDSAEGRNKKFSFLTPDS